MTSREHGRGFARALVATRYLLGTRGEALRSGLGASADAAADLNEIVGQLSHGVRQERARVLAAEVGRLLRALQNERIR